VCSQTLQMSIRVLAQKTDCNITQGSAVSPALQPSGVVSGLGEMRRRSEAARGPSSDWHCRRYVLASTGLRNLFEETLIVTSQEVAGSRPDVHLGPWVYSASDINEY
jgi:hypothetical protein